MKPTLKSVAEEAGVSKTAVSLYLNQHPLAVRIPDSTKKKIDDAVKKLNYKANFTARALNRGKTHTIGLVVADLKIERQASIASEMMFKAESLNRFLLVSATRFSQERELECIMDLKNRQVDGIIFQFGSLKPDTDVYKQITDEKYPIVLVFHRDSQLPHLLNDINAACRSAVEQIKKCGYSEICGIMAADPHEKRDEIFLNACKEAEIKASLINADNEDFSYSDKILDRLCTERRQVFIVHSAYNTVRLLDIIAQHKDYSPLIIPIVDNLTPELPSSELYGGIIQCRSKELLQKAAEKLVALVDNPDQIQNQTENFPAEFMTLQDYRFQFVNPARGKSLKYL